MPQTLRDPLEAQERAHRLAERLSALSEVLRAISTSKDLDQVLALVVEVACGLLAVERCGLFLVETQTADELTLRCRHLRGLPEEDFERIRLGPDEGITAQVIAEVRTLWTDDILADARFPLSQEMRAILAAHDIRGILAAPVVVRGLVRGLFYVFPETGCDLGGDEAHLFSSLALLVGIALEVVPRPPAPPAPAVRLPQWP